MKTQNTIRLIVLFACLFAGTNVEAQFLERLKDRVQKAAEDAVISKAEQKAAQRTEKAMDKVFDQKIGKPKTDVDQATLNKTYDFSWKYSLQMEHKKGDVTINYHLKKDKPYYGSTFDMNGPEPVQGMFMIQEEETNTMIVLMEQEGEKFGQVMSLPEVNPAETSDSENPMDDATFKKIGTKTILGYQCQGFQMENDEMLVTFYVAYNTPVSLNKVIGEAASKKLPKNFNPKWLEQMGDDSLMMEMDMVNKKKAKHSAKMTCIALEKEKLRVNLSDYQFPQMQGE